MINSSLPCLITKWWVTLTSLKTFQNSKIHVNIMFGTHTYFLSMSLCCRDLACNFGMSKTKSSKLLNPSLSWVSYDTLVCSWGCFPITSWNLALNLRIICHCDVIFKHCRCNIHWLSIGSSNSSSNGSRSTRTRSSIRIKSSIRASISLSSTRKGYGSGVWIKDMDHAVS